jgi:chromosome partitioning protein
MSTRLLLCSRHTAPCDRGYLSDAELPVPRIIALATLKGGSGKTTLAAMLAMHWHQHRETPALIDADPQRNGTALLVGGSAAPLRDLTVKSGPDDSISALVARLSKHHCPVIIDTPDFRSRATIEAISASTLVLVPIRPAALEVKAALETRHLVDEMIAAKHLMARPTAIRFILTMTNPGSEIARQVRAELDRAGFNLLRTEFVHRAQGVAPTPTELVPTDIQRIAYELENLDLAGNGRAA